METPTIKHLNANDYEYIYEPSQDTFLLLDAIEADLNYIEETVNPSVCLEIGSGSGLIITAVSKRLQSTLCLSTDINLYACSSTLRTANVNMANVESVHCNLTDAIRPNIVDLLIFNPPYVVTTNEEYQAARLDGKIACSWAGGHRGRMVIDKVLQILPSILSSSGVMYLLLLEENDPDYIVNYLKQREFKCSKFMHRKIVGEHLFVLKVHS